MRTSDRYSGRRARARRPARLGRAVRAALLASVVLATHHPLQTRIVTTAWARPDGVTLPVTRGDSGDSAAGNGGAGSARVPTVGGRGAATVPCTRRVSPAEVDRAVAGAGPNDVICVNSRERSRSTDQDASGPPRPTPPTPPTPTPPTPNLGSAAAAKPPAPSALARPAGGPAAAQSGGPRRYENDSGVGATRHRECERQATRSPAPGAAPANCDPGSARPGPGSALPDPGSARPGPGSARPDPGSARPGPGSARPDPGSAWPGAGPIPGADSEAPPTGANPDRILGEVFAALSRMFSSWAGGHTWAADEPGDT
jgi:hypothetical protein